MANEKILVVDDDKNICELLRLYLVKEGYNVTMVHDGGAALAEFDKLHPDLVLLDVMMPVMDGWEVCRKLRAKDNTPIIMLTAKGETYDKVLGLELGADDYIVKPFDAKEVTARIKAVLRRSSAKEEENKGVYDFDNLHLDMNRYELKVKGKVVEAVYNGSAIVTTSIGSEGIPEAERVMKVADGPEAFADEVVKMYEDPTECRRMCEETQKYIREYFSVEAAWKVIEEDFTPEKKR